MNSSFFLGSVAAAIGFFTLFTKFRLQQDNKETKSSPLSPPSPPSSSLSRIWNHHVFPSFHGADVRKTILSHILEVFRRKGIDSFIDNDIKRGTSIGPELIEAIRGSKIKIVLLSRNYASSSWCLDELAEIMKCREELSQLVMTIFYEVDPTDIRKQTGDFGKAFRKTCKGKTKEHIERWRKALVDVAKIAGEHSRNWSNEAAMIEKIATDVSNILNNSTLSRDFDGLVGIRAHMERMKDLLSLDLDEVRMIGIWGPPGIGKTTIARYLYHQFSSRFQLGAIMVDIKRCYPTPCLDEYNAQLQLQNQMLAQIINQKDIMISHLGVAQERLKNKKVFLVLDDVDRLGQLNALAKETRWFGPGSRIIITTEDVRVLKAHWIKHIYKVNFPSSDEAFQIFCMHAFGKQYPDDGFFSLAWEVTHLAGELPLGLKVLGSALRGMSKQEWERTIPSLKTRLNGEVKSIIKFSYDALHDEDKDLFLYIACIFNFEPRHRVEEILAKKFSNVRHSLDVLTEKSLISINEERIEMHTLLENFGRETYKKDGQLSVGERNICELLREDTTDGRRFIGIKLKFSFFKVWLVKEDFISEEALEKISDLQFFRIRDNSLDYNERLHSLLYHSQKIRSLHWESFQNICLPSNFNPDFLVELVMPHSRLQKLWEKSKSLGNLKWMNLNNSKNLRELPDLSTATNLQELILSKCSSLEELPSSIGKLTSLQLLDLNGCSSLEELPSSIGKLTSLQILNLRGCSSLIELPSSIVNATNLKEFDLSYCSNLVKLPSIENATKLEQLVLTGCSSLVELPSSISATNLQKLSLINCSHVVELPAIENATNLQTLELENCSSLLELPPFMGKLTSLQSLDLRGCSSLVELPSSIGNATNLQDLYLSGCSRLVKLPSSIENETNLKELDLSNCSNLVELTSINATNLRMLKLNNCSRLLALSPSIGTATDLKTLDISGCSSLVKLPSSIGDLTNLETLDLCNCSSLVELPSSVGNLQQLKVLRMCGCSKLEALPTNINLKSLTKLDLTNCSQLKSFPEISTNIKYLILVETAVKEVPLWIMSWSQLSDFRMSYFESLKEFPHALDIITELHFNEEDIQEVPPWVKGMSQLCELRLKDCNKLVSLPQFSDSLRCIKADNCKSLERLDCFFNHPYIRLHFPNCFELNQEARDLIMHTSTRRYAILPGTQVHACFDYRATAGGPLTITLNESSLPTSMKFKACILLVMDKEETGDDELLEYVFINIMDKQNDLPVACEPSFHYIDRHLTEHIYTFEVEAREVTSTELVFEFNTYNNKWKIGECGLYQILETP
ncbi:putative disease resistance protein RPP1 [Cardamine amara subsp. amara]|uniref:ADP-ribosyl cyclase/cyclic ADP-ribose hydrolase n=1 Tax=Cardamine amara subsp. amara TaxID=228776 RepID=A0ABD1BNB8_CARAN